MSPIVPIRPTIIVAGQESPALADALQEMTVVENVAGLYRCDAVFANWGTRHGTTDYLYFDRALLDFGKSLVVRQGPDTIFDGHITTIGGNFPSGLPPTVSIGAEDRLGDLRMTRRTRTFEDVSDGDVMRRIASDHGLRPQIDVSGPTHKTLAQVNQSDLAFLRDRARSIGAVLWAEGSTLHAAGRADRGGGLVKLAFGAGLREFSVSADLTDQSTSIAVNGWSVSGKEAINENATERVIQSELGGRTSGASVLESTFGQRVESVVHTVPLTSAEARLQAESSFKAMARRFVVGSGVADASARLRVGAQVELTGLGPLFNGLYDITESRQLFDGKSGMRTAFTAGTAGLGRV